MCSIHVATEVCDLTYTYSRSHRQTSSSSKVRNMTNPNPKETFLILKCEGLHYLVPVINMCLIYYEKTEENGRWRWVSPAHKISFVLRSYPKVWKVCFVLVCFYIMHLLILSYWPLSESWLSWFAMTKWNVSLFFSIGWLLT